MARHHEHRERDRDEGDEREQPRDPDHHDDRADQRQHLRQHLRQRLLQALRDVVDVVRDAAQQVAALRAVDVAERQAVELVFDVCAAAGTSCAGRRRRGGTTSRTAAPTNPTSSAQAKPRMRAELVEVHRAAGEHGVDDDVGGVSRGPSAAATLMTTLTIVMTIATRTSQRSRCRRRSRRRVVLPKSFDFSVGMPKEPKRMPRLAQPAGGGFTSSVFSSGVAHAGTPSPTCDSTISA